MSSMHFCPTCDNFMFISDVNDTLVMLCKHCNKIEKIDNISNNIVSTTEYNNKNKSTNLSINPNMKHDPAACRTDGILCVNNDCITNKPDTNVKREVIIIRTDEINKKHKYMCYYCETIWENIVNK